MSDIEDLTEAVLHTFHVFFSADKNKQFYKQFHPRHSKVYKYNTSIVYCKGAHFIVWIKAPALNSFLHYAVEGFCI